MRIEAYLTMIGRAVNERDMGVILQKARTDTDLTDLQFANLVDEIEVRKLMKKKEDTNG